MKSKILGHFNKHDRRYLLNHKKATRYLVAMHKLNVVVSNIVAEHTLNELNKFMTEEE